MANKYYLNDQLKQEFRDRVGRKSIVITQKLSEALKALGETVSKEEEAAESNSLTKAKLSFNLGNSATLKALQSPNIAKMLNQQLAMINALPGIDEYSRILQSAQDSVLTERMKAALSAPHVTEKLEAEFQILRDQLL